MKEIIFRIIFLILPGTIFLYSCNDEKAFDCVKSTGKVEKVERTMIDFDTLYLWDDVNVILVQDQSGYIIVEGGKNIIPKITSEVKDNCLHLKNKNKCSWVRNYHTPVNVYVDIRDIVFLVHKGSGIIKTEYQVKTDYFSIYNWEAGQVDIDISSNSFRYACDRFTQNHLKGNTHEAAIISYGLAQLHAENLIAKKLYMDHNGTGDAYVSCDSLISVNLFSKGNIYYSGSPIVAHHEESSSGKLIRQF
jgi:hypothetical protein